jgi:hypothetical protein
MKRLTTYAEEKKIKDRANARKARKFIFEPVGLDRFEKCVPIKRGTRVVKIQPYGCPRNGTMGHCYIGDADTGEFIGLVLLGSLKPEGKR